jgi:hypothetical protein
LIGVDDPDIADAGEREGATRDAGVIDLIVIGDTGQSVGSQRDHQDAGRHRRQNEAVAQECRYSPTQKPQADPTPLALITIR